MPAGGISALILQSQFEGAKGMYNGIEEFQGSLVVFLAVRLNTSLPVVLYSLLLDFAHLQIREDYMIWCGSGSNL